MSPLCFVCTSSFRDCAPVANQPQRLWGCSFPQGTRTALSRTSRTLLHPDPMEQACALRALSAHQRLCCSGKGRLWRLLSSKADFIGVWVLFCGQTVGKPAGLSRSGQEQSPEAHRNHRSDLHVFLLLPLRASLKFRGVSRLSLASSGYKKLEQASPQWYLSCGASCLSALYS